MNVPDGTIWNIAAAALLMVAFCGFALLFTGFARAQNAIHTLLTVLLLYSVGVIGFWAVGGAAMGPFPLLVAALAVVIPAGALAERWRLSSAMLVGGAVSITIYPVVSGSVWAAGWLAQLGAARTLGHGVVDFAGSGVVHLVGGMVALAGTLAVGPRAGKFTHDGRPTAMPGHHVPMLIAGGLLIAAGWFGFVVGRGLTSVDVTISLAAVNTTVAPAASLLTAAAYMLWRFGTPDPSLVANAWVAGLISISAGCAFVSGWASALVGCVSGVLAVESVLLVERRRIDDLAGVISVHGICGAWGLLAVGLFANGQHGEALNGVAGGVRGLFYGDGRQLLAQLIGVISIALFTLAVAYVLFAIVGGVAGNRVAVHAEREGLDVAELGASAYPDFGGGAPHDSRR